MKILAIDYGLKRVGLALSIMGIIMPYETIFNLSNKQVIDELKNIIEEENIEKIIIGLPISSFNKPNEMSLIIKKFTLSLKEVINSIPILFEDEHSSTKETISTYKNQGYKSSKIKKIKDMGSACIILTNYIQKNEFR